MYPFPKLWPLHKHISQVSVHTDKVLTQSSNRFSRRMTVPSMTFVKRKLQNYVAKYNTPKDKRLLECHAHCFIPLS